MLPDIVQQPLHLLPWRLAIRLPPGFSAVVDRLGEFTEVMGTKQQQQQQLTEASKQPQQQQAAASTADGGAGSREAAITTAAAAAVEASGAAASGSGSFGGSGSWDAAATEAALSGIQLRYMPDDGQEAAAVEAGALATAAGAAVASTSGNNGKSLLSVDDLHVVTPRGGNLLVQGLGLDVSGAERGSRGYGNWRKRWRPVCMLYWGVSAM